jgi:hypothetical protein
MSAKFRFYQAEHLESQEEKESNFDTEIEDIPNEFESESLVEEEVSQNHKRYSNITHEVSPEKTEYESPRVVRVNQSRPGFIDNLESIPKRSRVENKKQSLSST